MRPDPDDNGKAVDWDDEERVVMSSSIFMESCVEPHLAGKGGTWSMVTDCMLLSFGACVVLWDLTKGFGQTFNLFVVVHHDHEKHHHENEEDIEIWATCFVIKYS